MIVNKKIAIAVISLLVLSLFSGFAAGKMAIGDNNGNGKNNDDLTIQTASPIIVASQPVEDKSREFSLGMLNSCVEAGLRRGDTATFTLDGQKHTIKPGLIGDRYMQLSLDSFSDRVYVMTDKQYDLDVDGIYDLEITLSDTLNGKAYLSICEIDEIQPIQELQDEVLNLQASEEEANLFGITGKAAREQLDRNKAAAWAIALAVLAGILAFTFWKRH